ncbi:PREDICTED: ras GTPase-activating protein 3 [Gekko japonicus]|uniref:Ras GTPase-activating protein 3 n=1 Tax=Gekko japonicus TaxID=146911 RepID=A0ABM1K0K8_GEKJA|nr:PREDICTED: ras GTPase-activating protein 3 [Gekko japonicus]
MAVEEEGLRVFQSVKIKIGEAKNLPTYPGPNKMRDCYCTVNLDQEEVFRTKIVEKSLCPFYGEDFYCEIPRSFRHLSFYIFDRDVFRRDSIIGKVAIWKEDLQKYHNRDTWFQLQHVDADSEVQGKVHLELRLSEVITDTGVICHKLATRVLECQGLPIVNGQCDPYATVTLTGPCRSDVKKTKVKKKTNNPQFDEVFYFEITRPCSNNKKFHFEIEDADEVDKMEIRIDLWNASNLKFGDEFLGELRLPLKFLRQSSSYEAWYFLQPRDNGNKSLKPDDLGSLRLNVVYTEDHVFPSDYYSPLRDLFLKSADVEPVSASAAHVLGEVCREKQEAAIPLVRLFLHYGKIVPFISAIANAEICQVHKPCEIDPVKLKDAENLETNRENLRQYVDRIFTVITKSGVSCPTVMCDIFFSLRESAAKRFQGDPDVRYTAVSSFIFLRFFAPAILSPNLFQLTPHHPDPQTSRTLTLISKTIQTLGSLSKSKSASFKESYMASFYDNFNEQKYADAVKNFLELISSSGRRDHKSIEQPILLKEGFMIKRAQGRKRFGMKNFKKRWFRLTNHEFTYQKSKGDHPLCSIPIENILAVEKLEEESFKMKNMFQVIQPERALYIQANNCVEAKDWIDILTKVSQCNKKRLTVYHPSAYLNGHWLCCKATADNTPGCTPCTGGLPANIQLDIDGDRETERIYSLFILYMSKLEKMEEACGSKSVYDGPEQEEYSTFLIDDPQETYKTLKQIVASVKTLEQEHAQYKRDKFKKTKYGSQEHPIGDKSFQSYIRQQSEISAHSI